MAAASVRSISTFVCFPSLPSYPIPSFLQLEVATCGLQLSATQAAYFVSKFPPEDFLRVQALVVLFDRIVDIENVDHEIVRKLSCKEQVRLWRFKCAEFNMIILKFYKCMKLPTTAFFVCQQHLY